jgi:hypothetical protein
MYEVTHESTRVATGLAGKARLCLLARLLSRPVNQRVIVIMRPQFGAALVGSSAARARASI